jgi:hypothetical protein
MPNQTASFDPDQARHEIPPREDGKLQIVGQRPMRVLSLSDVQFACAEGHQLLGKRFDVIADHQGVALYVEGICPQCASFETAMYLGPAGENTQDAPSQTGEMTPEQEHAMRQEIRRVLLQVKSVRGAIAAHEKTEAA